MIKCERRWYKKGAENRSQNKGPCSFASRLEPIRLGTLEVVMEEELEKRMWRRERKVLAPRANIEV